MSDDTTGIPTRQKGRPPRPRSEKEKVLRMAAERDESGEPKFTIAAISKDVGVPYQTCRDWIGTAIKQQQQGAA